jgi:hypothetical protein
VDWKILPVSWERQGAKQKWQPGVSPEELRSFATHKFPDGHNVGMVVVAKDGPSKSIIQGFTWSFEDDENYVVEADWHRMNDPKYPHYRVRSANIFHDLPCTAPLDRRNIQQCLSSMSDKELTQLYQSIKNGRMERGANYNSLESMLIVNQPNTLYSFLVVTGKKYLSHPAINANLSQIRKT